MPMKIRPIRIEGNTAFVTLTKGYEAIIDAADVPLVEGYNWCALVHHRPDGSVRAVYALRSEYPGGKKRNVYLHRVIAGTPDDMEADHIDGDGLDNRKSNLRNATRSQNMQNQRRHSDNASGVKGVSWNKRDKRWHAQITVDGKGRHIGLFKTIEEAEAAYRAESARLHGEFGRAA